MVLSAVPCTFPMFGLTLLVSLSRYFSVFVMFRINMNLSLVCVSETGKMSYLLLQTICLHSHGRPRLRFESGARKVFSILRNQLVLSGNSNMFD